MAGPCNPGKPSRAAVLNHSKYLAVEEHEVLLPNGRVIPDWPWIVTPDYVNVVALTPAGEFVVFRQNKYAVDGVSLAPVGGYLEPGEDPLAAARRELLEETGYAADDWIDLGHYVVGGNRGIATGYLYLARGAARVAEPDADDLEEMELLLLSRDEVETALKAGEFKVLSWAATVALALLRV
ncbi:MAG: NUDIX hydrolase [Caldilineales bacterium]